jgi:hypothetical protein
MQFLEESLLVPRNCPLSLRGWYAFYLETIVHTYYSFRFLSINNAKMKLFLYLWFADESIYLAYLDFHPYVVDDLACTKEQNRWFSKLFEKVNHVRLSHCSQLTCHRL